MIDISLSKLLASVDSLKELAAQKLPLKTAFALSKALKEIDTVILTFNEVRIKRAKEFGKKDEKGELIIVNNVVDIDDEKVNAFQDEINALLANNHTVAIDMLTLESLGDITIEPRVLMQLDWLINN